MLENRRKFEVAEMTKPEEKREKPANDAQPEARETEHLRPPMPPAQELLIVSVPYNPYARKEKSRQSGA